MSKAIITISLTEREMRVLVGALQWATHFGVDFLWHPQKDEIPKRKRALKSLVKKIGKAISEIVKGK